MKKKILTLTSALLLSSSLYAGDVLTGDTRLACEAILCLSSGTRPSECQPSLNRYFGINHKKWKDTVSARRNFLRLCPVDNADKNDPIFADLRDNILPNVDSRKCTADYINAHPDKKCVRESCGENSCRCVEYAFRPATKMPTGCEALIRHSYTNIRPVNTCGVTKWYSQDEWNDGKENIKITQQEFNDLRATGAMNIRHSSNNIKICRRNNANIDFCNSYYKIQDIKKDCWVNKD
ncbi:conjugal transfer protein TrbM [Campylobacter fetus subsp. venerealis]|uniref:TrbM/KikA/MpfK family conjugal transfer protein n=1 Tax=Campylobacter fetus TaxID=196 RepID=UPI0008189FE9|nr:TrbM/KikA/MpfK family conjugal transfer protein [Campylobacter fetus]MBK3498187.1 conjugal transfer protein TrbM [Campylobacter fetus subsp. venerealis]MBK3502181.1 conjugal transfer protein TrbM [Campylobacter fetus subsp. venerealis]OCS16822.1 conjugal transfer protein TrbM [Campylobacter fetus subsp. venerealis]